MKKIVKEVGQKNLIDPQKGTDYCLLYPLEQKVRSCTVPLFSRCLETYHLTYMTLIWSAGIIVSGFLANKNPLWLLLLSAFILLQWFTDLIDGAVGRFKDTGLVKWGFYMDHFLDYVFLCSIIMGYHLYLKDVTHYNPTYLIIIAFLSVSFMINSYLFSAVARKVKISTGKIGPPEARTLVVLFNISLIIFGNSWIILILPFLCLIELIALIITSIRLQKELWKTDMKLKDELKNEKFSEKNVRQLWQ